MDSGSGGMMGLVAVRLNNSGGNLWDGRDKWDFWDYGYGGDGVFFETGSGLVAVKADNSIVINFLKKIFEKNKNNIGGLLLSLILYS